MEKNNNNEVVTEVKEKKNLGKKLAKFIRDNIFDFTCYAVMAAAGGYTIWSFKKSSELVAQQKEANRLQIEQLELDNELKRKELQEIPEVEIPEVEIPE